ncbi:MAG: SUMF1/EgtB/PvdO family nonheme iron enzyme [Anaerolineae bacterium]|nr:SUMF1/EgtB/PvdO family nonheme iron enzyme [Anaerolineae bacterium]
MILEQKIPPDWQLVSLAGEMLAIVGLEEAERDEIGASVLPRVRQRLVELITDGHLLPVERAGSGRALSALGDPRPGVGVRRDCWPDFVWCEVPAGNFIYQKSEKRTLPQFWITKYPVTYLQFQAFIEDPSGYNDPKWWNGLDARGLEQQKQGQLEQAFKYANHPRENVSWYEAMAFCAWLSAKLDFKITLPTEEQWEKAARGSDGRIFPYGNGFDPTKSNTFETGIGMTSVVGLFPNAASPYGVMEMSGNVFEWCLNAYENKVSNLSPIMAYPLRGGAWNYSQDYARTDYRDWLSPEYRFNRFGFRVVTGVQPLLTEH